MLVADLPTPALVVDLASLNHNIDAMAKIRPGPSVRSHVKAHKSTRLARYAAERSASHSACCATLRELSGMIRAGLGADLLLANETLDVAGLTAAVQAAAVQAAADGDARITVAIDSVQTLDVAAAARRRGPLDVLIDVNVGMPRCGVAPERAGELAHRARSAGLEVRGVMGYEGHVVGNPDRSWRIEQVALAMQQLRAAHDDVGGDIVSAGGTGTFDLHDAPPDGTALVSEVQAGSYLLMDTSYATLGLPFRQAVSVLSTVISTNRTDGYGVADAGLKAFGMDHGDPTTIGHTTFFCSDEHVTFVANADDSGRGMPTVGDRVHLVPAHVDPTMALHERMYVVAERNEDGTVELDAEVLDTWPIDLRNW